MSADFWVQIFPTLCFLFKGKYEACSTFCVVSCQRKRILQQNCILCFHKAKCYKPPFFVMFVGYRYLWFLSPALNIYTLNALGSCFDPRVEHAPKLRETVWGPYVSLFGVSKMTFLPPLWKRANHHQDNTRASHLCNNYFLRQAQSFLRYLWSLLNHRQLARSYFNW